MIDILFILWIIIFFIFMAISIVERSTNFGIITGFILLILGCAVIIDGIELQNGMTMNESGATTTIVNTYNEAVMPFSTISFIWGFMFIAIALYIIYANASAKAS